MKVLKNAINCKSQNASFPNITYYILWVKHIQLLCKLAIFKGTFKSKLLRGEHEVGAHTTRLLLQKILLVWSSCKVRALP